MYKSLLKIGLKRVCALLCIYSAFVFASAAPSRDPTEPHMVEGGEATTGTTGKEGEERAVSGPVLDAVLISGDDKFAIINNKLVKVGDMVGTSKVKTIDSYQVTLLGETGETVLELFGRPIKEPVK